MSDDDRERAVAGPDVLDFVLADATASEWRQTIGLPSPWRLFEHSIEARRGALPRPATLDTLRTAIAEVRGSNDPVASITARLIGAALEQRLLAEVGTGRSSSDLLRSSVVGHPVP